MKVSDLATQPPPLIQQLYVEVVRGVWGLGKGSTVSLHGLCPETEKAGLGFMLKTSMRPAQPGPPFQGWHPANFFFSSPGYMKGLLSAHTYTLTCTYTHVHLITMSHCNFQTEELLNVFLVP